jgi:hypothetical protein
LNTAGEIDALIREYADAHTHADEGTRGNWPTVISKRGQPCTPQMARLHDAEDAIRDLSGRPDLPEPVREFLEADVDPGCFGCWASSCRGRNHPECNVKIARWFAARSNVLEYGRRPRKGTDG